MNNQLKYILGAILVIPLLPLMAFQGRTIRASIPKLPEATGFSGEAKFEQAVRKFKLITIGESTIAGIGVKRHEEGFSGILAEELARKLKANIEWKVYAKSGYTAHMVKERLLPRIEENDVDVLVLGLGGNDAFTLNPPWIWRRDLMKLILTLRGKYPNTWIFFCNMPPIKEFPAFTPLIKFTIGNLVEILGDELNDLTKDMHKVHYFDDTLTLEGWIDKLDGDLDKQDFFSDGVHPSKLTYQTWAREIGRQIALFLTAET